MGFRGLGGAIEYFAEMMKAINKPFSSLTIHFDLNLTGLDVWLCYNDEYKYNVNFKRSRKQSNGNAYERYLLYNYHHARVGISAILTAIAECLHTKYAEEIRRAISIMNIGSNKYEIGLTVHLRKIADGKIFVDFCCKRYQRRVVNYFRSKYFHSRVVYRPESVCFFSDVCTPVRDDADLSALLANVVIRLSEESEEYD